MKKEDKKRVDTEMVTLEIRNSFVTPRDPSVWTKTEKERKALKKYRRLPTPNSRWAPPVKPSRFVGRLIVNVKGLDKTTYRHDCPETDIPYLLSKYQSGHSSIVRAFWNGKEINPEHLLK